MLPKLEFRRRVRELAESQWREPVTVVFLDEGQIIERGTPAQVLDRPREERTRAFLSKVLQ